MITLLKCVLYICKAVLRVLTQIFLKRSYEQKLKKKKKCQKSPKKDEGGDLKHVSFFFLLGLSRRRGMLLGQICVLCGISMALL